MIQPGGTVARHGGPGAAEVEPTFPARVHRHRAHLYEGSQHLTAVVADFLAEGLAAGEAVVVVAREAHVDAFRRELARRGMDVESAQQSGRFTALDSRDTLERFMAGSLPDRTRFLAAFGRLLARRARRGARAVRVYADTGDVLWKDGDAAAALRVEELWNDLARLHGCALLCAYEMTSFSSEAHSSGFHHMCGLHGEVVPTERFTGDARERALEVARLQQRAQVLETELARQEELQRRLRMALASAEAAQEELRLAAAERERLLEAGQAAQAEAASRARSELAAAMGHELWRPLNAISGYIELLVLGVYGPLTHDQQVALQKAQQNERQLVEFMNHVLSSFLPRETPPPGA